MKKIYISFLILPILFFGFLFKNTEAIDCEKELSQSSSQSDKDFCNKELLDAEKKYAELNAKKEEQSKQTGTLKSDINYLTSQINALKAKIKARSLAIASLKVSISDKQNHIEELSVRLDSIRRSVSKMIREINSTDDTSGIQALLSEETISGFFKNIDNYESIYAKLRDLTSELTNTKVETEKEKQNLEDKKNKETDVKSELEVSQKQTKKNEDEKAALLKISKEKETEYQKLADEQKAKANKIRNALFPLAGISQKIDFETALRYAVEVQNKTNIDPAFLLAVLTQETNIGGNVGKCNIPNTRKWYEIMPGPEAYQNYLSLGKSCKYAKTACSSRDDQTPFKDIVLGLGMDIDNTPISCPILSAGPWGGAMGPAQFIPTTWKLFESRISSFLGISKPNPWAPRDSFMASGIYLTDLGATGNSYSAELRAACSYYGTKGSTCVYGRSVMTIKNKIQDDIDYINRYGTARGS